MHKGERIFFGVILLLGIVAATAGYLILFGGDKGKETSPVKEEAVRETPAPEKQEEKKLITEIRGDRGALVEGTEVEGEENTGPAVGFLTGRVLVKKKTPLADARLILYRARHASAFLVKETVKPLLEDRSDGKGEFRLGPLYAGGGYRLVVESDDYAREVVKDIQVKEKGDTRLPDILLTPGITLTGKVRDEKNRPIVGARVTVLTPTMNSQKRFNVQRAALTNEKGGYLIEHVNDDIMDINFYIRADAQGFAARLLRFKPTFDGKNRYEYNFTLVKAMTLSGKVVDEKGKPIAGARVKAVQLKSDTRPETFAVTDKKGAFTLQGLAKSKYYLTAFHKLYSPDAIPKVPAGRDDVVFVLKLRSGMAGQVVDAGGAPVTSFWINAHLLDRAICPGTTRNLRLKFHHPEGRFILENLDPGRYELEIAAKGYARFRSKPVKVEQEVYTRDLVFTLSHGGSISGQVVSPRGDPLSGVYVYLHANHYKPNPLEGFFGSSDPGPVPSVKTGGDGLFRIEHVPVGIYQVEFRHRSFPRLRVDEVAVKEEQETNMGPRILKQGAVLRGRVYNDANTPLAQAKVNVVRSDNTVNVTVTTDLEGYYKISNLPPGTYRVYPTPPVPKGTNPLSLIGSAIRSQIESLEILEGEDKVLNLVIRP